MKAIRRFLRYDNLGWLYVLPALVYMLALTGWPIVSNIMLSLQDVTVRTLRLTEKPFVGLANYRTLFEGGVLTSAIFNTLLFTGFLKEFPDELEEAAIMDGTGLTRLCWSVVLPVMRPVIATIFIFNIVYVFNEFPFVSILINDSDMATLSLAVSKFQGQYVADYGGMMAAATLVLLPQLIIYAVFQKQVIAGLTAGAVKG